MFLKGSFADRLRFVRVTVVTIAFEVISTGFHSRP
jgi:hypothetical protein